MNKVQIINKLVNLNDELLGYGLYGGNYTVYVSKEKFDTLDNIEDKEVVQYLDLKPVKCARAQYNGTDYVIDLAHKLFFDSDLQDMAKVVSEKDNSITIFGNVFNMSNLVPIDSDYAIQRMLSDIEY